MTRFPFTRRSAKAPLLFVDVGGFVAAPDEAPLCAQLVRS
jgi:hypothetical protein